MHTAICEKLIEKWQVGVFRIPVPSLNITRIFRSSLFSNSYREHSDSTRWNRSSAMDSFSDSSRCDLDSVTSADSLHLFADEFRLRHVSTPDVSNAELSRRVAGLELENERLRVDLETSRIELNAKIAANQGLKDKITELHIEAQASLQERLRLGNLLQSANRHLAVAENSKKFYHAQIHDLQASKSGLQMEIDTYQQLVRQKHEVAMTLTARCKQSNLDYIELSNKFRKERQELKAEVQELRIKGVSGHASVRFAPLSNSFQARLSPDLSTKLETTEDELRDTRIELKTIEQRLIGAEVARTSLETALAKQRELISGMEVNIGRCEMEKDKVKNRLSTMQAELDETKSERDVLQATLLNCKQEYGQVEQAIMQLKSQLNKMIAQHKLIKTRNAELESKAVLLQDIKTENKTLKARSFAANNSLFKKLRDSKRKIRSLEEQLGKAESRKQAKIETDISLQQCLKRAVERNKELAERLKVISMTNPFEESIDEGYGDGFAQSTVMDLPSPAPLNPQLMRSISRALESGKNFLSPVEIGLEELRQKLEIFEAGRDRGLPNSGQMSPASPRNNARSVA